ncbi:hypothetical protein V6N13_073411 [Hibiscus sabdariffa]|uniref:Uncharacterized protein n=2 Tax=Hibiscus sabdariffa TaxID=183260 RepID=A0ABR1ZT25_9ROSI
MNTHCPSSGREISKYLAMDASNVYQAPPTVAPNACFSFTNQASTEYSEFPPPLPARPQHFHRLMATAVTVVSTGVMASATFVNTNVFSKCMWIVPSCMPPMESEDAEADDLT